MIFRIFAAFLATITFALIFNAPKKELVLCGFVGAMGWLVYELSLFMGTAADTLPVFFATVGITAFSRLLSMARKTPITVYLISGIIPFVPGAGIYYTMYHIIGGDTTEALYYGVSTLKTSGAISLGIMTVLSLPVFFFHWASKVTKS